MALRGADTTLGLRDLRTPSSPCEKFTVGITSGAALEEPLDALACLDRIFDHLHAPSMT